MILFTGGGKIASRFKEMYESKIVSSRKLNDDELSQEIKNAQIIIHNAALIYSNNFDDFVAANFLLTRRIVRICEEVNPDVRFINISTMSLLFDDKNYLPVAQMNDYAYSKFISENYCLRSGLKNITSLRFSTIFYGDPKRDGVSKLIVDALEENEITLYNNGEAKRDIIPLNTLVQYLHKICFTKKLEKKYNIASGKQTSFMDIATLLKVHIPELKLKNKEAETHDVLCDFSKEDIMSLGEISISLRAEIESFIKSYQ